jgi:hypothetical protein
MGRWRLFAGLPKSVDAAKPFAAPRLSGAPPARASRGSTSGERAALEGQLGSELGSEEAAHEDRPHKRPCLASLLAHPAWTSALPVGSPWRRGGDGGGE